MRHLNATSSDGSPLHDRDRNRKINVGEEYDRGNRMIWSQWDYRAQFQFIQRKPFPGKKTVPDDVQHTTTLETRFRKESTNKNKNLFQEDLFDLL